MCNHKFVYGGVKYEVHDWKVAGSGAHEVSYYDWFYCEKCLENRYEDLGISATSYDKIMFNATPKKKVSR